MAAIDGFRRFFPHDQPYDHQREAMGNIADALEAGRDVLFEGATGTGKTLAALTPALGHARAHGEMAVITTNVNQQTRQFIDEARAITRQERIRAVVFRGKRSMCHLDVGYDSCQTLREATRDLVDGDVASPGDRAHQAEGTDGAQPPEEATVCEYYHGNLTANTDGFYHWLYEDVRTPGEIYEYADAAGLCGYELLKEGMAGVDLVICNYHHLLDPFIREQFFRWIGRDPDDVVAVFDEAHNIASAARDHATRTLTERTLDGALDELAESDDARADVARGLVGSFRDALVSTYQETPAATRPSESWTDVPIANDDGRDDLTLAFLDRYTGPGVYDALEQAGDLAARLDAQYDRAFRAGETATRRECRLETAVGFIEQWLASGRDPDYYPIVSVRGTDRDGPTGRIELYTCLPRSVTESLFGALSGSVLMSATLRPFDATESVLGLADPLTLAYGWKFPDERRRSYAVDVPALYASRRADPEIQTQVTTVLEDAVTFTPGSVLAFFPSYAEAERYHKRVTAGTPYLDEPGTPVEEVKRRFVRDDDGVLFTSLWGTLTEGVSFDDDRARTVVVVGVPYPRLDDRSEAVQAAYDEEFDGEGWRFAVEIPTVRKARQAMGRVVRSPTDYGARVLVDERYVGAKRGALGAYSVHDQFPDEERRELIDIAPENLKAGLLNFYGDLDAWDGNPPSV